MRTLKLSLDRVAAAAAAAALVAKAAALSKTDRHYAHDERKQRIVKDSKAAELRRRMKGIGR